MHLLFSMADIQAFLRWLSEKKKATYRLPTEAEWEYCEDFYGPYIPKDRIDPKGAADPEFGHVIRGGSWIDDAYGDGVGKNLRSSARYHVYYPRIKLNWVGFRVVKDLQFHM